MGGVELILQHEIENVFGIQKNEIKEFKNLEGSNYVYSFIVNKEKYVIKKLCDTSIMDWEQEKDAYNSLQYLNITDELVCYDNGIKIAKFLDSEVLGYNETDMTEALDLLRKVHESGASIKFDYNIIENMDKCILHCDKKSKRLIELNECRDKINAIQTIVNKLNIPKVLCHGDACVNGNFLRLPDKSIKIIDWEQAGMADPLLDIAIASLHQGLDNVDPVWCLHQYLKRIPEKQEYLRLFSFLALDSYALMAWCIYVNPEDYEYFLNSAIKYSGFVFNLSQCGLLM
jgi:thiamine kinase-like enzyme